MKLFRQTIDSVPLLKDLMAKYLNRSHTMWALGFFAVCGCDSGTGSISGTITYNGQEVPSGTVSFFAQGKVIETEIQDGRYQINRVPLGEARITVVHLDPAQPDPRDSLNQARKQSADGNTKRIAPSVVSDPIRLEAFQKKRHLLPYHYASLDTTDLRCQVLAGATKFDIRLVDQPKID